MRWTCKRDVKLIEIRKVPVKDEVAVQSLEFVSHAQVQTAQFLLGRIDQWNDQEHHIARKSVAENIVTRRV